MPVKIEDFDENDDNEEIRIKNKFNMVSWHDFDNNDGGD